MSSSEYDDLRAIYPWPTIRPAPESDAFDWTLDGGGRDLLDPVFKKRQPQLMVEVGSFMGGSALRWLRENPAMSLVCVDPFFDNNADYIRSILDAPWAANYGRDRLVGYIDLIDTYGALSVVQNNLWNFRERLILVQGRIQDKSGQLSRLSPDIVFLDAMKVREEFITLDELFPDAIFSGDDWNWVDSEGNMPIPKYASEIAARRGGQVYGKHSTFLINEPRFDFSLSNHWLYTK